MTLIPRLALSRGVEHVPAAMKAYESVLGLLMQFSG